MEPVNVQAEFAKERNRAAAERTLMAWIRTCLALISFGFGIDTILNAIAPPAAAHIQLSRVVGLSFIALGTYAMVGAALEHRSELCRIEQPGDYRYRGRRSLALTVSIGIVCIGILAILDIFVRRRLQ